LAPLRETFPLPFVAAVAPLREISHIAPRKIARRRKLFLHTLLEISHIWCTIYLKKKSGGPG
jgi:hypothetical protein